MNFGSVAAGACGRIGAARLLAEVARLVGVTGRVGVAERVLDVASMVQTWRDLRELEPLTSGPVLPIYTEKMERIEWIVG